MALRVKRQDDLDAMFGKFAGMDLKDEKRDKFLKKADHEEENTKKAKDLIKDSGDRHHKDNQK